MANRDDAYMDEILCRKGFKELDRSLHSATVQRFWDRLKNAFRSEVELWNRTCDSYHDAESNRIVFYPNPFVTDLLRQIPELAEDSPAADVARERPDAPDLSGAPMWSVCAETEGRGVLGGPKARVFVWLTQYEPYQIMYSYGERCNHSDAEELPLRVEAGAMVFESGIDADAFAKREVRRILLPLMEA
jgi:hypothetical protein